MNEMKVAEIDAPLEKLGELTFDHSDNSVAGCQVDRLVHSGHTLMACSFVSSPGQVKAVRAMLHAKKGRVTIRASGLSTQYPSQRHDSWVRRYDDPMNSGVANHDASQDSLGTHVARSVVRVQRRARGRASDRPPFFPTTKAACRQSCHRLGSQGRQGDRNRSDIDLRHDQV